MYTTKSWTAWYSRTGRFRPFTTLLHQEAKSNACSGWKRDKSYPIGTVQQRWSVQSATRGLLTRIGISVSKRRQSESRKLSTEAETSQKNATDDRIQSRSFTKEEREKAREAGQRAKASEELWDTFVPDRKIGFSSPVFWVLAAACAGLHLVNAARERSREGTISEADKEEDRLRSEAQQKQRSRLIKADS